MSIDIRYSLDRDPDAGYLTFLIDYSLAAYANITDWKVSYALASNPNPDFLTGTGTSSDTVTLNLYLDGTPSVVNYVLDFTVWNTFVPVTESLVWNVLTAAFATTTQTFTGTTGIDFMIGGAGADIFNGSDGNDFVDASAGDDLIDGGTGADFLDGGTGDDTMTGGADDDIYLVNSEADVVVEVAGGGVDSVVASVAYTLSAQVENLTLSGFSFVAGTGNSLSNLIIGNGVANTLSGLSGNDELRGAGGGDRLVGGAGNDILIGDSGNDTMEGGLDHDTYYIDSSNDLVDESVGGSSGVDTVRSSNISISLNFASKFKGEIENAVLGGNAGLNITGNSLNNALTGNAGANKLEGGVGNDTLNGGGGSDSLSGSFGNDIFRFANSLGSTNIDKIIDYNPAQDRIELENAYFNALPDGWLYASAFTANTTGLADDASDRIIYETDTGKLFYDSNGTAGGGTYQHFATLSAGLSMSAGEFLVT